MASELDWPRLAEYVIARRVALGYQTRRALSDAIGVSDRTLAKVEDGIAVGRSTLGALDNGLDWRPGSANTVLQGGEPETLDGGRSGQRRPARNDAVSPARFDQPPPDAPPTVVQEWRNLDPWQQDIWWLLTFPPPARAWHVEAEYLRLAAVAEEERRQFEGDRTTTQRGRNGIRAS